MKKTLGVLTACGLVGGLLLAVRPWSGGEQRRIERQLHRVGAALSRPSAAGPAAAGLRSYFSEDFIFHLPRYLDHPVRRDDIPALVHALHRRPGSLRVTPVDPRTEIAESGRRAVTRLAVRVTGDDGGARFLDAFELRLDWRREGGRWLISGGETLPSLY